MIKEIKGNLVTKATNGEFDMIIQQCNCFNTMGSGIAKEIRAVLPEAYEADLKTIKGDRNKLGTFSNSFKDDVYVVNMYSQYNYGKDKNIQYTIYDAMESGLKKIDNFVKEISRNGKEIRIGIPKFIGCGLANGDWSVVYNMIEKELSCYDVTIVELKK